MKIHDFDNSFSQIWQLVCLLSIQDNSLRLCRLRTDRENLCIFLGIFEMPVSCVASCACSWIWRSFLPMLAGSLKAAEYLRLI